MTKKNTWGILMLFCLLSITSCSKEDVDYLTNNGDVYLTINEWQYSEHFNEDDEGTVGAYLWRGSFTAGLEFSASMTKKGEPMDGDNLIVIIPYPHLMPDEVCKGLFFPSDEAYNDAPIVELSLYNETWGGARYEYVSGTVEITNTYKGDGGRDCATLQYKNLKMNKIQYEEGKFESYPQSITINGECSYYYAKY